MAEVSVGDRVVVDSKQVGKAAREGEILEVLGSPDLVHYLVKWDDGHSTSFFPAAGTMKIISKAPKARSR